MKTPRATRGDKDRAPRRGGNNGSIARIRHLRSGWVDGLGPNRRIDMAEREKTPNSAALPTNVSRRQRSNSFARFVDLDEIAQVDRNRVASAAAAAASSPSTSAASKVQI
jgi:hypothetical protein